MWVDMMAIPKDAPNPKNAHLFLNFILQPEMMARISNKVKFANANEPSKGFIVREILDNPTIYPNEETMKKLFIAEIANPRVDRMMTRQWIKSKQVDEYFLDKEYFFNFESFVQGMYLQQDIMLKQFSSTVQYTHLIKS